MAAKQGGLGKGLGAIFIENDTENKNTTYLKISDIEPNRNQPRHDFNEEALAELADSIAQHGVLQPLLVRPVGTDFYQIVAGERRWRASRMAGIQEVPVIIRELTDTEVMQVALIENLQREDLSAIEEATGYKSLMETYSLTQEQVSKSVGKSRSAVANALRLLTLPQDVIDMISQGTLSSGHARTLLSLKKPEYIEKVSKMAVEKLLSVRELEKLCKNLNEADDTKVKGKAIKRRNPFFDEVELSLKEILGRRVKVLNSAKNKGTLQIEFYSDDDLAKLARALENHDIVM
ncbi:MAG: Stage 0 sporulation protein J [Eubacteriales bacterium SKADARSKE-1]|nr:Stage 0 sporulation protein J [Eubacteriales bacterium SKADARSKE-1]